MPSALRPERVVLRFTGRINKGRDQREDFVLARFDDSMISEALPDPTSGRSLTAYRLTPSDADRLASFRASLFRQKATQGGHGELEMTIHPEACLVGAAPSGPVLATTYLRTSETEGYVALVRDFDLRTVDPERDLVATAPACVGETTKG
ncbi:hypothetical protein [Microvirga rosea]|uniref:hypothetical protein n=1 Tax=Microvirga rosea TaxID=2715425 RepID=UPI001D0B0E6E|nr:hypothetical protein [Microvirga rosea]MCB8821266.1 hypothetical protein [Microvirga rosea]